MPGCGAGKHWDDACTCCVDDTLKERSQTLYRLSSQVTYAAIRSVFAGKSLEEKSARLNNAIKVLKATLKKLTADLPRGY